MSAIPDRKSAAVMFTDIVKATDMMAKDEEKALSLLKEKKNILKPLIENHDGIYVKGTGDGSLSYFDSPYKASLCAQIFQQNIYDRDDLKVRVGIHVGDIVFDEGDVYGDGVNVAKRLENMAPEGGICVSNSVYDELRNKKEFDGIDLGLQTLKGIGRLVEVFGLRGNKINAPNPSNYRENKVQVHTHDEVPSVAIIPFRNKGKEEEEFYAYGICSELISDVSSAGLIRVASLEKIMELGELSASAKASQLNVRYITTGMLWKMGDMFQLSIELYDTKDSKVMWSDQWQEHWDNLSTIKSNLSAGLLKALNTKKSFKDKAESISTEAYKYYLEAKFKFDNLKNESEIELIQSLLTKCFSLDVNLLEAKYLLAKTYFYADDHKKAKELSFQIIEKTEKDKNYRIMAEVIGNLGQHYTLRRDFNEGLKYFNRALEISKQMNDKQAIAKSKWGLAWVSVYAGVHSHDQVIDMFKSGISSFEELQDYSALIGTYTDIGYCYLHLRGQLEKSLAYFKLSLKLSEDFGKENIEVAGSLGVGIYYSFIGDFEKGDSYLNNILEGSIKSGNKTAIALYSQFLGESLFCQGKYEESLACFERTINISEKTDLRLWLIGPVLGLAINRKKLGIEIDYDNIKEQIEKYYKKGNWYEYYHNYLQYLLFEDNRYLQLAYDKLHDITKKLNDKDRKKLLNCPWPKMIIEEWEKNNEL